MGAIVPQIVSINGIGKPRLIWMPRWYEYTYLSSGVCSYTDTTAQETGETSYGGAKAGQALYTARVVNGVPLDTYGKILSIDAGVITVDGWSNGTPTNGEELEVIGWIADLPEVEVKETFTPDVLIHSLYGGDKGSKIEVETHGWKYQCVLDYSDYITPDTIASLRHQLVQRAGSRLRLIPHVDQPGFQYHVYYSQPISVRKAKRASVYQEPVFTFQSQENIPSWPIMDGYGFNYAINYGHGE